MHGFLFFCDILFLRLEYYQSNHFLKKILLYDYAYQVKLSSKIDVKPQLHIVNQSLSSFKISLACIHNITIKQQTTMKYCWPLRYHKGLETVKEVKVCWVSSSIGTHLSPRRLLIRTWQYCMGSLWQGWMVVWCCMVCFCFVVKTVMDSVSEK